ncbi:MAG: hypothetical protein KDA17_02560, partial [Candidatus Saccharibacteria bacterium]|nr:hypothetical protein [Candidatus Saccharibacteria bacterium]
RRVDLGTYVVDGNGADATIDVSGYAAVIISMYGNRASTDANHQCVFVMNSSVGTLQALSSSSCTTMYLRNLTTDTLWIGSIYGTGTTTTDECTITVTGLTSSVVESSTFTQDEYKIGGSITYTLEDAGISGGWIMDITAASTTAKRLWMSHRSGRHMLGLKAAGGFTELIFNDPVTYVTVGYLKVAAGAYGNAEIVLPNRPLDLYIDCGSGFTRAEVSLIPIV